MINFPFRDIDYLETWQAMEHLVDIGLVKSIGVSNFNSEQILRLVDFARIKPVVNQVECCPTLNQQKLIEFCKRLEVIVIAYCPLRHPTLFTAPPPFLCSSDVQKVGEKYNKTQVQIALRFLVIEFSFFECKNRILTIIIKLFVLWRLIWALYQFQNPSTKIT